MTDAEKICFVRRYFALFSEVEATEFHIEYYASADADTFDMRAAFLVAPQDCEEWLVGDQIQTDAGHVLHWFEDILPRDQRWCHTSIPAISQRPDGHAVIVAYRSEGIVLKRVCEPLLAWLDEKTKTSA